MLNRFNTSVLLTSSTIGGTATVLRITPAERRALQLVAEGAATSLIGAALDLSASDVDPYLSALFAKFGAATSSDAVAAASRRGLLIPSSNDNGPDACSKDAVDQFVGDRRTTAAGG
jgi:DNA-binding CsgD family transcriptional regulator